MRRLRGPKSLRFRLLFLCLAIILVMSLLCGYILISEYNSIVFLSGSLDTIRSFNLFNGVLAQFQQTFSLYADSLNRAYLQDCYDLLDRLSETSNAMTHEFPGEESLLENQRLVEDYTADARELLEDATALNEPSFWSRYEEINLQLDDINSNLRRVHVFYLQNVSQMSSYSIDLWNMQMRISLLIMAVSMCFLVLLVNRFVRRVTHPVMQLVRAARQIAQGDFSHQIAPSSNSDEIALLTNTFSYMSDTIVKQMASLEEKIEIAERLHALEMQNMNIQLSLTEKEMYLMQSMINPHFLFNCLSTVSSMAVLENASRTRDISTKIARYLRSSIDLVGSQICMREEIGLLNQYLYIQSIRFGDRITTSIECASDCESAVVPAMFLQPIVENSIVHGLRSCLKGGRIQISIVPDGGRMRIHISDNGCGMESARLEHLRANLHLPFRSGQDCIGLHCVISQLDILFSKQYSFSIESAPQQGTRIQIVLPHRGRENGILAANP